MSEHATTESDAALRAVAALLPAAGVLVLDGHGRLRVVSARAVALLGFADEDALRAQWPEVRHALGLPLSVQPCCAVPLGWPRGRYGPTTRKPVGDVVHLDHFGNQPWRGSTA